MRAPGSNEAHNLSRIFDDTLRCMTALLPLLLLLTWYSAATPRIREQDTKQVSGHVCLQYSKERNNYKFDPTDDIEGL